MSTSVPINLLLEFILSRIFKIWYLIRFQKQWKCRFWTDVQHVPSAIRKKHEEILRLRSFIKKGKKRGNQNWSCHEKTMREWELKFTSFVNVCQRYLNILHDFGCCYQLWCSIFKLFYLWPVFLFCLKSRMKEGGAVLLLIMFMD